MESTTAKRIDLMSTYKLNPTTEVGMNQYKLLHKEFNSLTELKLHVSGHAAELDGLVVEVEKRWVRPSRSRSPYTHLANRRIDSTKLYKVVGGQLKAVQS